MQSAPVAVALAIVATVALLWRVYGGGPVAYGQYNPSWLAALHAFAGWCWVIALIGFAYRLLDRSDPAFFTLNELLLAIYILHQTIIVIVAYHVEKAPLDVLGKYAVVLISSAVLTLAICIGVIRRFQWTRLLFGMKRMVM